MLHEKWSAQKQYSTTLLIRNITPVKLRKNWFLPFCIYIFKLFPMFHECFFFKEMEEMPCNYVGIHFKRKTCCVFNLMPWRLVV